jgi:hypothetical protein
MVFKAQYGDCYLSWSTGQDTAGWPKTDLYKWELTCTKGR